MVAEKLFAFHGPFPDERMQPKKVQKKIPCFTLVVPAAFKKDGIVDLKFMDLEARVFWSMPTPGNKKYLAWLDMVQNKCQAQWKTPDIFNTIQISRHAHRVNPCMLLPSLYFWEGLTNTFHLPRGMLKPTLFDVVAITGLLPLGKTFDPTHSTENNFFSNIQVSNFILLIIMSKTLTKFLMRTILPFSLSGFLTTCFVSALCR